MVRTKRNNIIRPADEKVTDFEQEEITDKPEPAGAKGKLAWLKDERLLKITGLVFFLFACYSAVAFISFLTSWQKDQSLVLSLGWDMFLQTDPDAAENWLGKTGAWLAYTFIYEGFGIASFLFSLIAGLIGIRLLTETTPLPLLKTMRYSFFALIWSSLLLGYIFFSNWQILGGSFGHFGYLYLKGIVGNAGVALLLIFYLLVFLVAAFNIRFYEPRPASVNTEEQLTPTDELHKATLITPDSEVENLPINPDDFKLEIKENVVEELPVAEEVKKNDETIELTLPTETEEEKKEEQETLIPPVVLSAAGLGAGANAVTTDSGLVLEVQETPEEEEAVEENPDKPEYGSLDSEYDPTLDFSNYQFPSLELLNDYGDDKAKVETEELNTKTNMIVETLKNYNIAIKKISATIGPTVTLYEIVPQDGVRIAKIKNLEDDIALSLAALGIRIIAPIPGRGTIGIEVPNEKPAMVSMRSVLASGKFQNADMDLPVAFGKNIQNEVFVADLAKMPHLLMAGATGQGKSVGLNTILISLLYKKHPSQIKFVLVDPKKVELSIYKTIERHFLAKIPGDADAIITDTKLVVNTLNSLCVEMDSRYDLLKDAQVRNLKEYNAKFISRKLNPNNGHRFLPYIVVVIDEVADLMMTAGKEVEHPIARLAQLARAIGIHLILATQRPSVNVITGMIKANFPARVAFRVSQKTDSRTILDANGADQLIGKGDMLYTVGNDLVRLQCAFVDTPEVDRIANFIGNQQGKEPYVLPEVKNENEEGGGEDFDPRERDSLFDEAAQIIVQHQQGSTSLLQRRLNLGYNRAGRLIDQLERAGIVGPFKGSKAREVLISDIMQLEQKLKDLREE
ncbi:MAG: DNA translocase FtsK 4TM domain-containing protein [Bacteroidota bacterium]|jgi:S-DNA-T family DNA segregation ATPase FtsK/SpoIIIE|nr:DNA translocase FtsK [Sphingobacteriales bacterium]